MSDEIRESSKPIGFRWEDKEEYSHLFLNNVYVAELFKGFGTGGYYKLTIFCNKSDEDTQPKSVRYLCFVANNGYSKLQDGKDAAVDYFNQIKSL